jgi:large subunit ribosomal protein L18
MQSHKEIRRGKIRQRIRKVVKGTAERPRLSVFRSNKQIYAQIIDDINGVTLAAATSRVGSDKNTKIEQAANVGKSIGEKAVSAGITQVVFDRGGYLYHGRIKALADSAREAGLKF